jgi:predicted transposase/invertase (TIGR01784 family)
LLFCEDLQIHLIELPKFKKSVEELTTALDRWLYFLRHGAELDVEALPPTLAVTEIRRALEVIAVFTQEERDRELYQLRKMAEMDKVAFPLAFRQEGIEEGRKEGREAGIKEGREAGLKEGRDAGIKEGRDAGIKEGHDAGIKEGRDAGIKEGRDAGIKEGREEGLQKGEVVGRIHLSQRLLKQAPTPREELLKLSLGELHRLAENLEQQLLSSTNGTP